MDLMNQKMVAQINMNIIPWSVVFFMLLTLCGGARILGLVLIPSRSHAILVERLLRELTERGHDVTMVTPFPSTSLPNFTYVGIPEVSQVLASQNLFDRRQNSAVADLSALTQYGLTYTETFLEHPEFDKLKKAPKFDLIVTEAFLSEAVFSGFSATNEAPVVAVGTCMPLPWVNFMVGCYAASSPLLLLDRKSLQAGNPTPWSYIPDPLLGFNTHMTLWQRIANTLFGIMVEMNHHLYFIPKQDALMRKFFGRDLPYLEDIVKNVSVVLVNHHYSLAYPRAYTANMIEVGGLHVDPPKALPKDIKTFMDDATHGVIFFSLGSNLKSSAMPKEKLVVFLNAFSKIKQRVLWKFEENLPGLPSTVKIMKWLPQSDILAHPNIKAFITHGGLLSTTEAVHRGVPVIGIPIFGDQPMNMRAVVNAGLGVTLSFDDITEETLVRAINKVINDPKYNTAAKLRSQLLRDTPLSALDRAVFWVEYVLRHQGATHLQSKAQRLSWFQLYMLDIIFCLLVAVVFVFVLILGFCKIILTIIRKSQTNQVNKKNE